MWVEQAIYTSLPRDGRSGYHVVSRSRGVSEADARALANWSPSHGALILDASNRVSVNFHPLPEGRCALSRSCEGPLEYSGRGGRQLYTHALIFQDAQLERSAVSPLALYRDAHALGHFRFRADPAPVLEPAELGLCHRADAPNARADGGEGLDPDDLSDALHRLIAGGPVQLRFPGDRLLFAERLLGLLPREVIPTLSFSTSLRTSSLRPYRLSLLD